jgi:hypothetical protein
MKRKDSGSVRVWSVLCKAVVLILLAAAAFDGGGRAVADGPGQIPPPPDGGPIEPSEWHVPNTLYSDEPGAIALEELSPEEQQAVLDIGEHSDYGAAVHGAWSAVTHTIAAEAETQTAAHQSGTRGLDTIGVEP